MKIGKNNIQLFILLFAVSSLLVHFPPEAFAEEGVIATITVGADPNSIAFDSENNRMYVTNSGGTWNENNPLRGDSISVIDTSSYEVIETVTAAGAGGNGNTPHGIAFDPVNNRMYYAIGNWQYIENDVSVMNTADNSVSATISVGNRPNDIAFDSTNNRVYVVNRNDSSVSAINTATNGVIATISVGVYPQGIAFDSTNNRMYVTNWNDNTVSVINTADNSVIGDPISVGDRPYAIAFDSTNNRMYVLNNVDNTVSVINTADNSVIATISVGHSPNDIAFDSTNNRMYVLNTGADTVSVIDTANNSVIDTISVGHSPRGIAFDSTNNRMYVTNTGADTVSVIGILAPTTSGGSSRDNNDDLINPNPHLTDEILVSVGPNKAIVTQSDGISNIQIQKGDSITITLNAADNKGPLLGSHIYNEQSDIESVSLYTNFGPRPSGMNLYHANHLNNNGEVSKTFYEWNADRENVIYDFTKSVTWHNPVVRTASFDTSTDDSNTSAEDKLTITFYSTWNEVMPKSEIIVKVVDSMMGYSTTTLPFTLQVGDYDPSFEDIFGSNTNYRFVPLTIDSKVRESIHQWVDPLSGMTDERFVSSLGLHGDELPGYVKYLAQWVVEDKIDLADLIIAVEYIINIK